MSALTAQSAFLNNFEDIVNRKVDVREDIKRYQNTLSYASSKVDYSVGEHLYMLPSNMTLKIRPGTVGTIIKFSFLMVTLVWGKMMRLILKRHLLLTNSFETPAIKNHKTNSLETPTIESRSNTTQGLTHAPTISHEDEKAVFILLITGGFTVWFLFR